MSATLEDGCEWAGVRCTDCGEVYEDHGPNNPHDYSPESHHDTIARLEAEVRERQNERDVARRERDEALARASKAEAKIEFAQAHMRTEMCRAMQSEKRVRELEVTEALAVERLNECIAARDAEMVSVAQNDALTAQRGGGS